MFQLQRQQNHAHRRRWHDHHGEWRVGAKAKYALTQAKDDPLEYEHHEIGYNYRLTNLQAAMGCAQLEQLDAYIARKRETARVYAEAFAELPGITPLPHAPWAESIDWMFTMRVNAAAFGMDSRALLRRLEAAKIQSRPLWQPMHRSPAHAGAEAVGGEVADALCRECLSLPCSADITDAQRDRVIAAVRALPSPLRRAGSPAGCFSIPSITRSSYASSSRHFLLPLIVRPTLLVAASYFFYLYAHFGMVVGALRLHGHRLRQRARAGALARAVPAARGARRGDAAKRDCSSISKRGLADLDLQSSCAREAAITAHRAPSGHFVLHIPGAELRLRSVLGPISGRTPLDILRHTRRSFPARGRPDRTSGERHPQLKIAHAGTTNASRAGSSSFSGVCSKLVIADPLAVFVRGAYALPHNHTGLQLLLASYAFAFQIFCDFSAYTDIARGTARILGINLMENFRAPYSARSIPEFWSRWHISLSTWFRDYLYIPMGGNRVPWLRWQFNILVVFVVSGIWHGADWKFAVWGLLHAVYFLLASAFGKIPWRVALPRFGEWLWNAGKVLVTFHLVVIAWVFFRAESMKDALYILRKIAKQPFKGPALTSYFGLQEAMIALGAIVLLEAVHVLHRRVNAREFLARRPIFIRWPAYYALIFAVVFFAKQGRQEFIYFQF